MCSALPSAKTCCQCETIRPASQFLPSPLTDDGLTARCKPCVFGNAERDRQDRESRRQATRVAAGGSKRRQRSKLTPSSRERIASHV